ncbi:MAG: zinc ribbon domain-containing protein [Chitinivibrionales bacterium]|nr:zinc ribbon domain-containing protein [Chitinivibrionales bacterium]MBD3396880.1 zinc ribbon domain-containing protein [Chitinivibrionales bacterium]
MPMYEYKCRDCGADFEELVSINAKENPSCPKCHSAQTEKKMSVFGSTGGCASGSSGFT